MIKVRIRNGLKVDPISGLGGATEGYIRGQQADIIDSLGGVVDVSGGHVLVTQQVSPNMTVHVAKGTVYVPNTTFDPLIADNIKFWEVAVEDAEDLNIGSNSSGSTRYDLICVKVDITITPDEYASNISTLVVVAGTPGAGVPATPTNYEKIAEIEIINGATTIPTAKITDRRRQLIFNYKFIKHLGIYAADTAANDDYLISIPGFTAYYEGMILAIKATTANTGAATLNLNSLGAKAIKKNVSAALDTNDILAGQILIVMYDGTNFQIIGGGGGTTLTKATAAKVDAATDDTDYVTSLTARKLTSAPASDNLFSGLTCVLNANEAQAIGDVCYIDSDGQAHLIDADAITSMSGLFMATGTINANADGVYLMLGFIRHDAWNWTVGGLIYGTVTGTSGNTLSQTAPSGADDVVQILGVATHADRMFFKPQLSQVVHI